MAQPLPSSSSRLRIFLYCFWESLAYLQWYKTSLCFATIPIIAQQPVCLPPNMNGCSFKIMKTQRFWKLVNHTLWSLLNGIQNICTYVFFATIFLSFKRIRISETQWGENYVLDALNFQWKYSCTVPDQPVQRKYCYL